MPFTSDILPIYSRQEFCRALKAVRERKGITLAEIATATKVPASLFAGLEENDLKHWPKGLFRRSFFRDYVRMLGLPVNETCEEFVRLFPEQEGAALSIFAAGSDDGSQLNVRLVLDAKWHGPRPAILPRILAAFLDAGVVGTAALVTAMWAPMDPTRAAAIVATTYFSMATIVFGESPAKWMLSRRQSIVDRFAQGRATVVSVWSHGADTISGVLESDRPETVEEPHLREVRVKAS
jgi:transcriptional regulator with XRE-family HTH domain